MARNKPELMRRKKRDPYARKLAENPEFKPKIINSKKRAKEEEQLDHDLLISDEW